MKTLIFVAVVLLVTILVNRYFTAQNKKKFAEVDARLAKEGDD